MDNNALEVLKLAVQCIQVLENRPVKAVFKAGEPGMMRLQMKDQNDNWVQWVPKMTGSVEELQQVRMRALQQMMFAQSVAQEATELLEERGHPVDLRENVQCPFISMRNIPSPVCFFCMHACLLV
jgi:hypothetical protein